MKYLSPLLFLLLSFRTTNEPVFPERLDEINRFFVQWNRATFQSLETQIKLSPDSSKKHIYENRLSAIKGYIDVNDYRVINTKSIRYQFLYSIFSKNRRVNGTFYIIEENSSGEVASLKIFVAYKAKNTPDKVEYYAYINDVWRKNGVKEINVQIGTDLKKCFSKFGKGFNFNDIIITRVLNNSVEESEYFLHGTLSESCCIKEIVYGQ